MARLQDYPSITPTSSDKLLVVQSQGQGLVPYGSKLDSANPTGTGSLSLNRIGNTGSKSVAIGNNVTASNYYSFAEGSSTVASGIASHAEGNENTASANSAHAEGYNCVASGNYSHAQGNGTIANHLGQTALGAFNLEDGTADAGSRGTYIEIVGKGTSNNARSNARTLDWNGNEVLAGGLKINGNQNVAIMPKRIPFSGTTSANGNLSLSSLISIDEVIFAISARDADNTSTLYVGIPYQYATAAYGWIAGAHFLSETLSGDATNKNVEGYIWVIKYTT